ncbi:MAG: nicotinate phosphoribosyltransferase [Aggregatilineales bacterium]
MSEFVDFFDPLADALFTDLYQLTMLAAYFRSGLHRRPVAFEYSYREPPFGGRFAIFAGLHAVIEYLERLRFTDEQIEYLRSLGLFDAAFLNHLRDFRFTGSVEAMREGEILLPSVYGVRVIAAVEEAQLIETALLTLLNFPTLIATKAARVKFNAEHKPVLEFGMRRAQGVDGALTAARAAFIGGADATSNVSAGHRLGIPVRGTHAHSYVMFYPDELSAFQAYAGIFPRSALFLVDTYDVYVGLQNAIRVANEMRQNGEQAAGVRLDSGDLVYWSIVAHVMLEAARLPHSGIVLSNELDEHRIALIHNEIRRSCRDEGYLREVSHQVGFSVTRIDPEAVINRLTFGVGTQLITGGDQASLGGIYKLIAVEDAPSDWQPRIKLSAQPEKTTLPGFKKIVRLLRRGLIVADLIALPDERIVPGTAITGINPANSSQRTVYEDFDAIESLHIPIFEDGQRVYDPPSLLEIKAYANARQSTIRIESRRLEQPHSLKVSMTEAYWQYREAISRSVMPARSR